MNKAAQQTIEEYINHTCEAEYLRSALAKHGAEVIVNELAIMLQSANRKQAHVADVFLRDIFSYLPINERPPFQKVFDASKTPAVGNLGTVLTN